MVKKILVSVMCITIIIIGLSGCSEQIWTYEEYTFLKVSPEGEKYYIWGENYYIDGLKKVKLLGILDIGDAEEKEFGSEKKKKEYLNYIDNYKKVYSVSAPDDSVVVQYDGKSTKDKYLLSALDGKSNCSISFKVGQVYNFDYRDTNVSSAAFVPYDEIPDEGLFDYEEYVSEHGIFGDDAKAVMSGILFDKSEEDIFSEEAISEAQSIGFNCEQLGRIVYYPEDCDWFCYDAEAIYNPESGFYLRVYRQMTYDVYPISRDTAKKLGIDVSGIEG